MSGDNDRHTNADEAAMLEKRVLEKQIRIAELEQWVAVNPALREELKRAREELFRLVDLLTSARQRLRGPASDA